MPNTLKRCSMEDGVKGLACSSSIFIFSGDESPYRVFTPVLGEYMELDDAVLAHAYGELGDSAACALWEGFLLCVRVLSRSRTARESFKRVQ